MSRSERRLAEAAEPTKNAKKAPAELSSGFVSWLIRYQVSLVCSSYQTKWLLFIGSRSNGTAVFSRAQFPGAMGLAAFSQRIYLAGGRAIWRLENTLRDGELAEGVCDRLFVPRNAQFTGNLNSHEIAVEPSGRIVFVATKYSCLATVSMTHAFRPIWKPPFISKLAPEDRCHLNGLGMDGDRVRYVTACATTDLVDGWREHRAGGGVLIDITSNQVVAEGFSMPHSPRVHRGSVWLNNSGAGYLCRVDPQTGLRDNVVFCPGFLRGLAFVEDYAVVTLSLPRNGRFQGLALDDELAQRKASPWCGLLIVDTRQGNIVEWARLGAEYTELFDVAVIPATRAATGLAPESAETQDVITYEAGNV